MFWLPAKQTDSSQCEIISFNDGVRRNRSLCFFINYYLLLILLSPRMLFVVSGIYVIPHINVRFQRAPLGVASLAESKFSTKTFFSHKDFIFSVFDEKISTKRIFHEKFYNKIGNLPNCVEQFFK